MKIKITFKDPDGVSDAISEILPARRERYDPDWSQAYSEYEEDLGRWLKYSEYVTIEFDTEAGTATVMENKQ